MLIPVPLSAHAESDNACRVPRRAASFPLFYYKHQQFQTLECFPFQINCAPACSVGEKKKKISVFQHPQPLAI